MTTTETTYNNFDCLSFVILFDDNLNNFLTTCSCLAARQAYKIRPVVLVVVISSARLLVFKLFLVVFVVVFYFDNNIDKFLKVQMYRQGDFLTLQRYNKN